MLSRMPNRLFVEWMAFYKVANEPPEQTDENVEDALRKIIGSVKQ